MSRVILLALMLVAITGMAGCSDDSDSSDDNKIPPVTNPEPDPDPDPDPDPEPEPEPNILLDEDFEAIAEGKLPEGWMVMDGAEELFYTKEGSLFVDGRGNNYTPVAVRLPEFLQDQGNYRIEVSFTIAEANTTSRWVGMQYRTGLGVEPYYQMAIRQNATAANGTEHAFRNTGQWSIVDKAGFSEVIDPAKLYTATIVVHGDRVQQYLNGTLLQDSVLDSDFSQGGVGFQAAGSLLRVEGVTVTEQLKALPPLPPMVSVAEPETGASMAPSITNLSPVAGDLTASPANSVFLKLDDQLMLSGQNGGSLGYLDQMLDAGEFTAMPMLYVTSQAAVDALKPVVERHQFFDLTLVSDNQELLKDAREKMPFVRAAVDFTHANLVAGPADLLRIVQTTNQSKAKIAILPESLLDKTSVQYIQNRLISVWGQLEQPEYVQTVDALTAGVNGLLTTDPDQALAFFTALPENTLLRKPLVVGHRGVPSQVSENTVAGALKAVELGADAVESDIYLTTDNQVVVMHDGTVDRTTDGTGAVEEKSLAELKALTVDGGHSVPTMDEFFTALKGKRAVHFVEIKSGKPEIVEHLKAAIERHGVHDQVIVISFNSDQLLKLQEVMPGVSGGFLTGFSSDSNMEKNLRTILNATQQYSSTFNPSYGSLAPEVMEAAKHRGTTFWPWTFRNLADAEKYYLAGTHGLTTDYAQWFSDYPVTVEPVKSNLVVAANSALLADLTVTTQVGNNMTAAASDFLVLESTVSYANTSGSVVFEAPGSAVVVPLYEYILTEGGSYYLVGARQQVTIN